MNLSSRLYWIHLFAAAILLCGSSLGAAEEAPRANLDAYERGEEVAGELRIFSVDRFCRALMKLLPAFKALHPNVTYHLSCGTPEPCPPEFLQGRLDLLPLDHPMPAADQEAFERLHGYRPWELKAAHEALVILVHRHNPIRGLAVGQVASAFAETPGNVVPGPETWGDLGLAGDWAMRPLTPYGSDRATYSSITRWFHVKVLGSRVVKPTVKGSFGRKQVEAAGADLTSLSYGMFWDAIGDVRAIPLAGPTGGFVAPSAETCRNETYPLTQTIFLYGHVRPQDRLVAEFMKFVASLDGQRLIEQSGYFPAIELGP